MRPGVTSAAVLVSLSLLTPGTAGRPSSPLPERMADTGGGTQLLTAVAPRTGSTSGTVTWWDRENGRWAAAGSAPARFGASGLTEGSARKQGTNTTPTGLYGLPYAFGIEAAPRGTAYPYRPVRQNSWWCQVNGSRSYNRWTEPRAADCRAGRAEHLIGHGTQYAHALVVDFNYRRPVRGRARESSSTSTGAERRRDACPYPGTRCGRSCAGPIPRVHRTSRSARRADARTSRATAPRTPLNAPA